MPNYRQLHEESLAENRPEYYRQLKRSGQLQSHLNVVKRQAKELHQNVRNALAKKHPYNPVEWKNSRSAWEGWLDRSAEEVVLHDLVLVPDLETERAMRDGYTD